MKEVERDAAGIRAECKTFAGFVRHAWRVIEPGMNLVWGWHLDAMCAHLEAISRGQLKPRLIINVPPGSSKSTIVSVLWQAWEWGPLCRRHLRYVSTSFDLTNVKRDTAKTRDVIKSPWYQSLWPQTALKTDGVTSFSNHDTGSRLGVSFYGVTGKRGDRLLVDDPHSLRSSESATQRDAAVTNFIEGGLNRTNDWETSAIIVVMQRLHENDLTGVLLARDFGFVHLMIPMELEIGRRCETPLIVTDPKTGTKSNWIDPRKKDGDPMDPTRVPPAAIEQIKKSGEYSWASQYQQRPAPREGGMFKVDLIETVEFCPPGGTTVAAWDFAASKRKNSPYTVRVLMTRVDGSVYIRHVARRRVNPTELEQMIVEVSVQDRSDIPSVLISMPQDPGSAGKVQKWRIAELLAGFNFKVTTETGDKETRALPFAAQVGAERVFMVKGDWNGEYTEELRNFPGGSLKDQVDASSRAYAELVGSVEAPLNAGPELIEAGASENYLHADSGVDPWGDPGY